MGKIKGYIERMPIWEYHGKTEEELSDMPTV